MVETTRRSKRRKAPYSERQWTDATHQKKRTAGDMCIGCPCDSMICKLLFLDG